MRISTLFPLFLFLFLSLAGCGGGGGSSKPPVSESVFTPQEFLLNRINLFHNSCDVYTDADSAGNHFIVKAKMFSSGDGDALPTMNEASTNNPRRGISCIRASFKSKVNNWGGWCFMNGVLEANDTSPKPNWGDYPGAGVDLTGATELTFWARGAKGGERVEFFCAGVGRDPSDPKPFPDSSNKISTGYVILKKNWSKYKLDLAGRDLSYVLGGFGWVTNAANNKNKDISFFLDDIRYDKPSPDEQRFIVSFQTKDTSNSFDTVMRNAALSNDNAVALMSFLAVGDLDNARLLADAFVYAQLNDRYYTDSRVRNAYQGGDIKSFPGWETNGMQDTVRLPGWYEAGLSEWVEDSCHLGSYSGNVGWVMIALLMYYGEVSDYKYLGAAADIAQWIHDTCEDASGPGGYIAGYHRGEDNPLRLGYKSTVDNMILHSAFKRLYFLTGNDDWKQCYEHAGIFLMEMWDGQEGKFWMGTEEDGVTINKYAVPIDAQALGVLLAPDEPEYARALDFAEVYHKVGGGFDFNEDRDGIWWQGTAQMALAYHVTKQTKKRNKCLSAMQSARFKSGGLPAASRDNLSTACETPEGDPVCHYRRAHVGTTAWFVLAQLEYNPFSK